jgi:hypothetical protein
LMGWTSTGLLLEKLTNSAGLGCPGCIFYCEPHESTASTRAHASPRPRTVRLQTRPRMPAAVASFFLRSFSSARLNDRGCAFR